MFRTISSDEMPLSALSKSCFVEIHAKVSIGEAWHIVCPASSAANPFG
jgi:hypothetical protein